MEGNGAGSSPQALPAVDLEWGFASRRENALELQGTDYLLGLEVCGWHLSGSACGVLLKTVCQVFWK
jgi:hypothetical protein